jgi:hypothetical protein
MHIISMTCMKWTNSLENTNYQKSVRRKWQPERFLYLLSKIHSENLPLNKTLGKYTFTGILYQIFKEEILPVLYITFQKIENKRTVVTSLNVKSRQKYYKKRKLQINTTNKHKSFQQSISKGNPATYKKDNIVQLTNARLVQCWKAVIMFYHVNRLKKKTMMWLISTEAEKCVSKLKIHSWLKI